ncbi:MAG: DinB superfamily protein [Phycisphaerales bacterium]|nr:DinB superfamily protein [Phycisphaerales bacterium]
MSPIELMSDNITRNGEILKMTLSDFSQEDMLARPVPGANHAAWQLGHLIGSAAHMINAAAPGIVPEAAARIGEKCSGKTANVDDPAYFPDKTQLLEAFAQTHGAIAEWVKTLAPEQLARPTPGPMADFAPTVGHLILMTVSHIMMHVGQCQVIRRKLGKPLLF